MDENIKLEDVIAKNLAEGIYLIGSDDLIIKWVNPTFEKMFGYRPGEMVGKQVDIVNAPADKTPAENRASIVDILKKTGEWHGEVYNIKKDGTHFWCYANVSTFKHYEYGEVWVAVHTDITERKQAEEKMKELAEEWQKTFDAIADFVFLQNKDFTITKVNKALAEALKSKPEDICGKKCYELLHKRDNPWPECPFEKTMQDKKYHIQEVDDPNIGIPLLVSTSPFFNDKGEVIAAVHIARDISEIKKMEKKQMKKMHELEIFHKAEVDRELKMIELKKEIAELKMEISKLRGK